MPLTAREGATGTVPISAWSARETPLPAAAVGATVAVSMPLEAPPVPGIPHTSQ
ncbi:hypothetical protein [Nocardioides sambongensis]|uniref:hypothetical protein n=1 Tax=Nocardioides sambongensis TaxID=2589074 RepID=UPI001E57FEDB|nr:hypothetical protein [Nocardioides sambongensis]